jgi:LysR family glycine cleavage system transcriptional activator
MVVASHLKSFQALEIAVRTGALKEAADVLGITPAAVGQRIKTLEEYLGIDLVTRGRSGLRPTAALSKAIPHLARAFRELGEASEALDVQRVNEIQIAANPDWVELWLAPRLPRFRSAYPNIRFCINGEGDVPMRLGRTDVEVSFRERNGDEGCSHLFHDFLMPISSPENAARISGMDEAHRLEDAPLLHLDFYRNDPSATNWPKWIGVHGHRQSDPARGMRFQRIAAGLEVVLSDAGFMICGLALITEKLESGDITLPFPVTTGSWTEHAFQAAFRREPLLRPQVARFREWLEDEARSTADRLSRIAGSLPPQWGSPA